MSDIFTEGTADKFDEWVYVLKNSVVKSNFTAKGIQEASEKLDVLKMTPQQRAVYERDRIIDMSQKSQIYTAELKGHIKGKAIGMEEGKAIGSQKEKEEAVIRGHNKGHSIDTIAEFTNLTPDQILKILKENGY